MPRFGLWVRLPLILSALAGPALLAPAPLLAQSSGSIRGVIVDGAGAPIEGAAVTVSSAAAAVSGRAALSDGAGQFQILALPPAGDYRIAATHPAYGGVILSAVEVGTGRVAGVNIVLPDKSAVSERVEVRARSTMVGPDVAGADTRFSSEFLEGLPILGRDYQDVLALAPGVSDVDGDGNPNIHGARDTDVVTQVDGVSTTDPLTGQVGAQLNIESIQEIELKTMGASAEYGRAQGGFVNITTKSGGNELVGAFKFFWRGSALDGDGAGIDDPALHAGLGESGLRDLRFNDFMPFLSLEGPIVRDHAWFFMAHEYIQTEEPVNALNLAFVRGVREYRGFLKATWQVTPVHRAALSVNYDPQEYTNLGLNSFTATESGYTVRSGGTVITTKLISVLTPLVALETSLSSFEGRPALVPNLDRDSNGNGMLYDDVNDNGFGEASERDPGEDYDQDGLFDVYEDRNRDGRLGPSEDRDGDGRLTPIGACEGRLREDLDCDGHLDDVFEDFNHDGWLTPDEDIDGDRRMDEGIEDRNSNRLLDDTARPAGPYPYGRSVPQSPDRDFTIGQITGVMSGPYYLDFDDRRSRATLRLDLSVFVPDFHGSHDIKMGVVTEREKLSRTASAGDIISTQEDSDCAEQVGVESDPAVFLCSALTDQPTVNAILHAERSTDNSATNLSAGIYVQDNFKLRPNLSIGIGVRYDREVTDSYGYSAFDPAAERAPFDRLTGLAGAEIGLDDFLLGNNDGLANFGIVGDPIFLGAVDRTERISAYTDGLRAAALSRMSRHHSPVTFGSAQLGAVLSDLFTAGELDIARLQQLGIRVQRPEEFRLTNDNLSPRLSVSWDPAADGRTRLFATWGRYYDKLFLQTIVGERGPDALNRYYQLDADGVRTKTSIQGNVLLSATPNHYIGRVISKAAPSTTQVDRLLRTPFSDEMTAGFERELAPDLALSVTYVDRRYRDQLQDTDINHTMRHDANGAPLDALGQLVFVGGRDELQARRVPDGRPDLYINNFFFNQILRIGNDNSARYRGIELRLSKRVSRRWEMQGSYTYSRVLGDAEDFQSRLGDDPSTIESEFGYLDYDQRHVIKLNAMSFLPGDWRVGWAASWATGLPYSVVSRFFALDNTDMQQFRTRYGYTVSEPGSEPVFRSLHRNSERNDATFNLDLSVRKQFVLGRTTAALGLDVFNVLNSDDLRIYTYEPNKGDFDAGRQANKADLSTGVLLASPLQLEAERRFGRRFQVGFMMHF